MHALSLVHGIGAALACAAGFHILGSTLIPRAADKSLGRGEFPAILGAALYVLLCWFGVAFAVPVTRLAAGFGGAVLLAVALRYRWLVAALGARGVFTRAALGWLLAFVALYTLTYLFTMPPVTAEFLPPAWTGNVDLLTYVLYTKHVLGLGPSNLAGFSFLGDVYLQTPAVFYILGLLAQFFGRDPFSAAMPAQFAFTALIGLLAARISRAVFGVSRVSAVAIACILVSGPFFRYVTGAYYLSTMVAAPVLLYLIWTTATEGGPAPVGARWTGWGIDVTLALRFACAYVLLLFTYPLLLVVGLMAQAATVALTLVAECQSGIAWRPWREALGRAGRMLGAVLVPLVLLVVCLWQRVTWSIDMIRSLSQPGVAGWPLDMISPLALLGVPAVRVDRGQCAGCLGVELGSPTNRATLIAVFCGVAFVAGFLYFWRFRRQTTSEQRALTGLAAGSWIGYCAYFLRVGPSYQQWKLASYSALPLSFVLLAGSLRLLQEPPVLARAVRTPGGRRGMTAVLAAVAVLMVGGNLLAHALWDPELMRFPGELRHLAMVDSLPGFRDMAVQMQEAVNDYAVRVALYFLPSKRVHVISERFDPTERLSYERISRQRPLLIQNYGCEGVGHADTLTVPGVGCLLFGAPSVARDTAYPFSESFLFVEFGGMGARQSEGRWNRTSLVRLSLIADPQRVPAFDNQAVNLLLSPYLPPGTPRQRLVLSWGADRHGEIALTAETRISLPVQRADWMGGRVWNLPIAIALPDAVVPSSMSAPKGQGGADPLAVLFEELSMTVVPQGQPVVAGGR